MAKQHTMNVSLTPQLAKMVRDRVRSGEFASASEVVREGLRAIQSMRANPEEELKELRAHIRRSLNSARQGRVKPADQVVRDLRAKYGRRRKGAA